MSRSLNSYKSLKKNKKTAKTAGKYVSKTAASLERDKPKQTTTPPTT